MANREKYIEVLSKTAKTVKEFNEDAPIMISLECVEDILELLKEPEAKQVELHGNEEWWGPVCVCPDCKAGWMSDKVDTHFCPMCGRPVKWE